eukprot:6326265-Prymnesium_polylepis.1
MESTTSARSAPPRSELKKVRRRGPSCSRLRLHSSSWRHTPARNASPSRMQCVEPCGTTPANAQSIECALAGARKGCAITEKIRSNVNKSASDARRPWDAIAASASMWRGVLRLQHHDPSTGRIEWSHSPALATASNMATK